MCGGDDGHMSGTYERLGLADFRLSWRRFSSYPADRFVWEGGDHANARWRTILPTESRDDYVS